MVDAHCHLNFKAFENDIDKAIKKAFKAGVTAIINVGTSLETSKKAIDLAKKYDSPAGELFATVGIHPHHADKLEENWEEDFEKLAKHPRVVAIGECGLDYFEYESNGIVDPKIQKEVFVKQIKIAHKLKLPLQIHNRHAGKDILQIISDSKSFLIDPPGMFHCFSGDIEFLKKVLSLGFYIGFDGNITYQGKPKGEDTDLKDLVKSCPIDRLIVETDSPYLTPEPHRGSKNTPEYAIITGEFIAEIKGLNFNEVNNITTNNAKNLFKLNL